MCDCNLGNAQSTCIINGQYYYCANGKLNLAHSATNHTYSCGHYKSNCAVIRGGAMYLKESSTDYAGSVRCGTTNDYVKAVINGGISINIAAQGLRSNGTAIAYNFQGNKFSSKTGIVDIAGAVAYSARMISIYGVATTGKSVWYGIDRYHSKDTYTTISSMPSQVSGKAPYKVYVASNGDYAGETTALYEGNCAVIYNSSPFAANSKYLSGIGTVAEGCHALTPYIADTGSSADTVSNYMIDPVGRLMHLTNYTTKTAFTDIEGWTDITRKYGIANSKLYRMSGTTVPQEVDTTGMVPYQILGGNSHGITIVLCHG